MWFIRYALTDMLHPICFIWYALSDMHHPICFIWYALSDMLYPICFIRYALYDMLYPICFIRHALSDMLFECMLMTTPCACSWGSHAHVRTARARINFEKKVTYERTDGQTEWHRHFLSCSSQLKIELLLLLCRRVLWGMSSASWSLVTLGISTSIGSPSVPAECSTPSASPS